MIPPDDPPAVVEPRPLEDKEEVEVEVDGEFETLNEEKTFHLH